MTLTVAQMRESLHHACLIGTLFYFFFFSLLLQHFIPLSVLPFTFLLFKSLLVSLALSHSFLRFFQDIYLFIIGELLTGFIQGSLHFHCSFSR